MTDQDQVLLLQTFRAGDPAAFEKVFRLYYKPLHMQAYLLLKDSDEAEDQVQQLFTDIWNRQLYTKPRQSIKAYLHAALRNRCLNHLIRTNIHTRFREEYAGHTSTVTQPDHRPGYEAAPHPIMSLLAELP
ncbi:MAG TPA: sigma factor, partial [Bryobacteraceae bacterium]